VTFNRVLELLLYSVAPIATLATTPILAHGLGPAGRGQYGVAIAVAERWVVGDRQRSFSAGQDRAPITTACIHESRGWEGWRRASCVR
jgi:hypothetical protein